MKFSEEIRDQLDLILNEATFIDLYLNETENSITCKFELLKRNNSNDSNYIELKLENIKKYISTYRIDIEGSNKVIKFEKMKYQNI
ncbi:MAG TPA: hypothetical protein VKY32_08050 [Flavobacterium sp.]|nr:hypothetical protein [Flavobacterium sp.]